MLHAARLHENIHHICESLENKSGGDDFFLFSQSPPPELFLEIRFDQWYKYNVFDKFLKLRQILADHDQ